MALGNLASRVLVAVVAVPLLLLAMYQESALPVWGLSLVAGAVAMYEFFAMTLEDKADRLFSTAIGVAAVLVFYWFDPRFHPGMLAFLTALYPSALYYLFRFRDIETVASRVAYSVTGVVYAGLCLVFLALLKRDLGPNSGHYIALLLATGWLSDTGGYFAGKLLGKHKLYEAVSPNKTWEGAIGGVIAAAGGGVAFKLALVPSVEWIDVALLVIPGSILGQLGDLCESLIKRSCNVKDSGAIIPGHGGVLDRIDAVLFVAPYFYVYLTLTGATVGS